MSKEAQEFKSLCKTSSNIVTVDSNPQKIFTIKKNDDVSKIEFKSIIRAYQTNTDGRNKKFTLMSLDFHFNDDGFYFISNDIERSAGLDVSAKWEVYAKKSDEAVSIIVKGEDNANISWDLDCSYIVSEIKINSEKGE
jgi:hypothetical protein